MLTAYLLVGSALFALGLTGFVTRKNLIIIFLCTELMFQGVIVNLVALGRFPLPGTVGSPLDGQIFSLFLLAVAASEAALGLAIVVLLFRNRATLDANAWKMLKEE
jgi:NADH-quinone oxidoreductase subunit K